VGVYFVTQNPADVPDKVLGQLGNRVQHALRAFSPQDQKAVRAAAQTMRDNSQLDEETIITELGVGEALISMLDEKGRPSVVERAFIIPPNAQIGPVSADERQKIILSSLLTGYYEAAEDRESAYEIITAHMQQKQEEVAAQTARKQATEEESGGMLDGLFGGSKSSRREGVAEAMTKSVVRTIGSEVGRQIIRGVLGSILGSRRR
jgi:uncharacterized protein